MSTIHINDILKPALGLKIRSKMNLVLNRHLKTAKEQQLKDLEEKLVCFLEPKSSDQAISKAIEFLRDLMSSATNELVLSMTTHILALLMVYNIEEDEQGKIRKKLV